MLAANFRWRDVAKVTALLAVCLLIAEGLWIIFIQYSATSQFNWAGTITSFRQAEPRIYSTQGLDRYSELNRLAGDPQILIFRDQLLRGGKVPVRIEHDFFIGRQDSRDIRDAREVSGLAGGRDKQVNPPSGIAVTAYAGNEADATALNTVITDYVIDTLLRQQLLEAFTQFASGSEQERMELERNVVLADQLLASLDVRIQDMTKLRNENREIGSGPSDLAAITLGSAADTAHRFLSPARQLIGLETQRSEQVEQRRINTARIARLGTVERFARASLADLKSLSAVAALEKFGAAAVKLNENPRDDYHRREARSRKT